MRQGQDGQAAGEAGFEGKLAGLDGAAEGRGKEELDLWDVGECVLVESLGNY